MAINVLEGHWERQTAILNRVAQGGPTEGEAGSFVATWGKNFPDRGTRQGSAKTLRQTGSEEEAVRTGRSSRMLEEKGLCAGSPCEQCGEATQGTRAESRETS